MLRRCAPLISPAASWARTLSAEGSCTDTPRGWQGLLPCRPLLRHGEVRHAMRGCCLPRLPRICPCPHRTARTHCLACSCGAPLPCGGPPCRASALLNPSARLPHSAGLGNLVEPSEACTAEAQCCLEGSYSNRIAHR